MKLYPYDLPPDVHPMSWLLLGHGLMPEQVTTLAKHLFDDMGLRFSEDTFERSFSWAVGVDVGDGERVEVGDTVDVLVAPVGGVRVTGGVLPPGVRLERHTGRMRGVFSTQGVYSVTITVGPSKKYDPLGSPGGPGDPGVWIPVDQPRAEPVTALSDFPATAEDLDDSDKDRLLAELLAWRDGQAIKEADVGH